jgi:O-acetyl-ADP-ribose deacetylase (regulator of RNase III)
LQLAEDHGIRSVAFPAISTGAFGYPLESAVRIALKVIFDKLPNFLAVKHIRFVLFSNADQQLYEQVLGEFAEA